MSYRKWNVFCVLCNLNSRITFPLQEGQIVHIPGNLELTSSKSNRPGRHGDLMVSVFVSGLSGPGPSPRQGHCGVFYGGTL